MPQQLEPKILDTLSRPDYKPVTAAVLARDLNVTKKRMQEFRDALEELIAAGKVRETADGLLRPQAAAGLVQGTIKKTAAGAGFLIPHKTAPGYKPAPPDNPRANDVFIAPHDLGDAQTGDEVLVQLHRGARAAIGAACAAASSRFCSVRRGRSSARTSNVTSRGTCRWMERR